MKTRLKKSSKQPGTEIAGSRQRKQSAQAEFEDKRISSAAQQGVKQGIDNSPMMMMQRRQLEPSPDHATQRVEEEELMQGKFDPAQRQSPEEEELMQGKFDPAQRQSPEEEELMQGKFDPAQRQSPEEEELMQGKFDPAQRQSPEEEELMQGKFDPAQRQSPEEEELMQGKFDPAQRQSPEEEELMQGKFDPAQRQSPEEEELMQGKFIQPVQREQESSATPNQTGMPDNLKQGLEILSGMDMSAVRVHYNSPKPEQINAHAYAQGDDVHLASGQEKHLPHEAWHTVQQRQGRVQPTMQMAGEKINDDVNLEREADVMGAKALQHNK